MQILHKDNMRPYFTLEPQRYTLDSLKCEGIPLSEFLKLAYTPFYLTSLTAIQERVRAYKTALSQQFSRGNIFYAMKANFSEEVLKVVSEAGAGIDIVSIGEWRKAQKAGVKSQSICFAGVGKTKSEIDEALSDKIGIFNVEHASELTYLLKNRGTHSPIIALRLNPCVESVTHPHLKTGALDSKFGMLFEQIETWLATHKFNQEDLKCIQGIHVHIGSQLLERSVYKLVMEKVLQTVELLAKHDIHITHLDLGGGLKVGFEGVPSDHQDIFDHVSFLAHTLREACKAHPSILKNWGPRLENLTVNLEPGRSIVASSTLFITKVLYSKNNQSHYFAYVDGGMNDFPRPAIYGAKHAVEGIFYSGEKNLNQLESYQIVGPVCESGDVLATQVSLPEMAEGDILAFCEAGAYCRSMASHYNLREIPAEVFVKNGKVVKITPPIIP